MIRRILEGLALVFLLLATPGRAAVLVDTGTPTGSATGFSPFILYAAGFNVNSSTRITGVEIFMGGHTYQDVNIYLYANDNGLPGTQLFATKFGYVPTDLFCGVGGPCGPDFTGAFGLDWTVDAGTYWVGFLPASFGSNSLYNGAPNPVGMEATQALDIPSPFEARSVGNGVKVFGDALAAAVPEPVSWAMLIAGFLLLCAVMRAQGTHLALGVRRVAIG